MNGPTPKTPLISGLKTCIETPLLDESIDFYTRILDMKLLQKWDEKEGKGAILGLNSSLESTAFLEISHCESDKVYPALSLQFRVPDIDLFARDLIGKVEFQGPDKRPWDSIYIYLKDPSGVQIIIYEGVL